MDSEVIVFRHSMQPAREHFGDLLASHSAGKPQLAFVQITMVRVGGKEALHQHRETGMFRIFPYRHRQRVVDLRQQRAPFAVGHKTLVPHHFKNGVPEYG